MNARCRSQNLATSYSVTAFITCQLFTGNVHLPHNNHMQQSRETELGVIHVHIRESGGNQSAGGA